MLSIYNYDEPLSFIQSYIGYKKTIDTEFSIRKWSQSMGFSSPAVLSDILKSKRKIKNKMVTTLAEGMDLDKSETMYFQALVSKAKALTDEEKRLCELMLLDLSPASEKPYLTKYTEDLDIFSHWVYLTIFSMADLKNFSMTPENIVLSLREKLPFELVQNALNHLIELGILEKQLDGTLKKAYHRLSSVTDKKLSSVKNYYEDVCELAKGAIDLPLEAREFQCGTLAINHKQIPLAKEIIRECYNKLASLEKGDGNVVYQTNLMFFPLTETQVLD